MKSQPSADDSESRPDEDREAIISRRQFLIASSLAGAGIGVAATGCRPKPGDPMRLIPSFQPCLSVPRRREPESDPEPPEPNRQWQPEPPEVGQESADRFGPSEPDSQDQANVPKTDQDQEPQPPYIHTPPQVCLSVTAPYRVPRQPPGP